MDGSIFQRKVSEVFPVSAVTRVVSVNHNESCLAAFRKIFEERVTGVAVVDDQVNWSLILTWEWRFFAGNSEGKYFCHWPSSKSSSRKLIHLWFPRRIETDFLRMSHLTTQRKFLSAFPREQQMSYKGSQSLWELKILWKPSLANCLGIKFTEFTWWTVNSNHWES